MSAGYRFALLFIIALSIWTCASGHRAPYAPDLPVVRPIEDLAQRLHTADMRSDALSITIIGRICYADFNAPIWLASFTNNQIDAPRVLVTAGVHGNEPAGVECAVQLIERMVGTPDAIPACTLEVIPLVNPWGWSHHTRFNRRGVDINRDFASFDSDEARIVCANALRNQYHLIIDLHEDPAARGFYMYQYGRQDTSVVAPIIQAVAEMGYPVEQDVKMVILKTENGVIDAPMWGLWYMKLTGQLSITNYGRLYNSPNVFTIETPTVLGWEDRLKMQQYAIERLFAAMLEEDLH